MKNLLAKNVVCLCVVGALCGTVGIDASDCSGVALRFYPERCSSSPALSQSRPLRRSPQKASTVLKSSSMSGNKPCIRGDLGMKTTSESQWKKLDLSDWSHTGLTNVDEIDGDNPTDVEDVAGYQSTGLSLAGYPADFLLNRPSIVTQSITPLESRGVDTFGIMVDLYNNGVVASPRMDLTSGPGVLRF